jgi:hypothetical protein
VIDKIPADRLEEQLRVRAKHFGVTVMEHRAATDLPGMKSEMDAILANLGAIPTELTLGGEDLKVTPRSSARSRERRRSARRRSRARRPRRASRARSKVPARP